MSSTRRFRSDATSFVNMYLWLHSNEHCYLFFLFLHSNEWFLIRSCLSRVLDGSELGAGNKDGIDGMSFTVASFVMLLRCIHELVCIYWCYVCSNACLNDVVWWNVCLCMHIYVLLLFWNEFQLLLYILEFLNCRDWWKQKKKEILVTLCRVHAHGKEIEKSLPCACTRQRGTRGG